MWEGGVTAVVGEIVKEKDGGEGKFKREGVNERTKRAELAAAINTHSEEKHTVGGSASSSFNNSVFGFGL